ncbi:hypothetical protein C8F04DRAFT_1392890 [Mycena alexandri]|uniref:Uncharacterized protein n=1 Tax=Mycena alexandri TaxID=1745969 RepID=A0AAD6X7S3_9AGAR|nr:hypothetical protein C8F04DRAFT_1392890 [Mycena alexandri]
MAHPPPTAPKFQGTVTWLTSSACHALKHHNPKTLVGLDKKMLQANVNLPLDRKYRLRFLKADTAPCLVGLFLQGQDEPVATKIAPAANSVPIIFIPPDNGFYKGTPDTSIHLHVLNNVNHEDPDRFQRLAHSPSLGSETSSTAGPPISVTAGPSSAATTAARDPIEELDKETARLKVLVMLSATQALIREFETANDAEDVDMGK